VGSGVAAWQHLVPRGPAPPARVAPGEDVRGEGLLPPRRFSLPTPRNRPPLRQGFQMRMSAHLA
jgi:hypothetical protein